MSIEEALEQIFQFYRSDDSIRAMFVGEPLSIVLKFLDTKKIYTVYIDQNQEISLHSDFPPEKPDIQARIKSEQIFLDLINGKIPIAEPFVKGKIIIVKGFAKIARLYKRYVK